MPPLHPAFPVTVARPGRDWLGEGPSWDASQNELISVDIAAGLVRRWNPETDRQRETSFAGEVSAAVPRADGGLILAIDRRLTLVDRDGQNQVVAEVEVDLPENRFNDCRCDPQGRLWAGTMSKERRLGSAGLYRLDPDGEIVKVLDHTTISNGMAWSESGELMYFIDSPTQRIDAFDFDGSRGEISGRRPFVEIDPGDGLPDGMTIDEDGCVWVALFGGGAIRRYSPEGALDVVIGLPTSNPTCPAFGGSELDTLYVTSARHRLSPRHLEEQRLAGALFAVSVGIRGRLPFRFAG